MIYQQLIYIEHLDSGVAVSDPVEQRRWMDEHTVTERPTGSPLSTEDPHFILGPTRDRNETNLQNRLYSCSLGP